MSFGEIVEPSTRALNGEDYEFLPENIDTSLEWEGDINVPTDMKHIIFIESARILKIFDAVLNNLKPFCTLNKGLVRIYNNGNGNYIVSYVEREITTGEIIVSLKKWLEQAQQIDAITSGSLVTFLTTSQNESNEVVLRKLSSSAETYPCKKLEQPNIVTGLGAQVVSYCLFTGLNSLKSTLYIFYMLNTPLDSISTQPVLELINYLGLQSTKRIFDDTANGNLYS